MAREECRIPSVGGMERDSEWTGGISWHSLPHPERALLRERWATEYDLPRYLSPPSFMQGFESISEEGRPDYLSDSVLLGAPQWACVSLGCSYYSRKSPGQATVARYSRALNRLMSVAICGAIIRRRFRKLPTGLVVALHEYLWGSIGGAPSGDGHSRGCDWGGCHCQSQRGSDGDDGPVRWSKLPDVLSIVATQTPGVGQPGAPVCRFGKCT
jgi:hypothetical protein